MRLKNLYIFIIVLSLLIPQNDSQDENSDSIHKVLISVSSSKIKSAVKRNLLKRRIKESYRINKNIISNKLLMIAFVYVSEEIFTFSLIDKAIKKILKKLSEL